MAISLPAIHTTLPVSQAEVTRRALLPEAPETVRISQNPYAFALEMAEEIGFIKTKQRNPIEENDGVSEKFKNTLDSIIQEATALHQKRVDEAELQRQVDQLRGNLPNAQEFNEFNALFFRFSKGSASYNVRLYQALTQDQQLQKKGFTQTNLRAYATTYAHELQASINLSPLLEQLGIARTQGDEMLAAYEETVVRSQTVLETLKKLDDRFGITNLSNWREFMLNAVAADLASFPAGGEVVHLQFLLDELKSMRVFNTISAGSAQIAERLPGEIVLLPVTLNYALKPMQYILMISEYALMLSLEEQILYHQAYRNLIKNIVDDAFSSRGQKEQAIKLLQDKINDLVYSEEAS